MNKKIFLLGVLVLSLLIPGLFLLNLESVFSGGSTIEEMENSLLGYRLRVWLSWIIMVGVAIYYKWTTNRDIFFKMIYPVMVIAFGIEGIYIQRMIYRFEIPNNLQDPYTYGIMISILNIITVAALTAFLQIAVWWFTKKRHRQ